MVVDCLGTRVGVLLLGSLGVLLKDVVELNVLDVYRFRFVYQLSYAQWINNYFQELLDSAQILKYHVSQFVFAQTVWIAHRDLSPGLFNRSAPLDNFGQLLFHHINFPGGVELINCVKGLLYGVSHFILQLDDHLSIRFIFLTELLHHFGVSLLNHLVKLHIDLGIFVLIQDLGRLIYFGVLLVLFNGFLFKEFLSLLFLLLHICLIEGRVDDFGLLQFLQLISIRFGKLRKLDLMLIFYLFDFGLVPVL